MEEIKLNNLYKKRYAIGIYRIVKRQDETDELLKLFDSPQELAEYLEIKLDSCYVLLRHHQQRGDTKIYDHGVERELALIDMREDL